MNRNPARIFRRAAIRHAALAALSIAVAGTLQAQEHVRTFAVDVQPAATGLNAFAEQADVALVFSQDAVAGIEIRQVRGAYSVADALALMLRDTGLEYQVVGDGTIAISGTPRAPAASASADAPEERPAASGQAGAGNATTLDRVLVTGSRIKRAEIEGALPVTVLDRAQIDASGEVSIADFLRDTSFNSFGSYQSSSGSGWASVSAINLRGMGENRTLVLIDGRRAPIAPMTGSAQDLNSIPMAAVERIEILSDGASAVYGSDALAGVVNIITRKDFQGAEISYGRGFPVRKGGDSEEGSILIGSSSDRGRILAGLSYNYRQEVFTRDRDFWMGERGGSIYSNNFQHATPNPNNLVYGHSPAGYVRHPEFGSTVPGYCMEGINGFWTSGSGAAARCQYDHKLTSTQLTDVENLSLFSRGDYNINDNWRTYFNASVSRVQALSIFAPVLSNPWPGTAIFLPTSSPNHPGNPNGYNAAHAGGYDADTPYFLYHRFAALGTRDNAVENTTRDFNLGFEGRIGPVDLDFGVRHVESRATNTGRNYVVGGLAQVAVNSGAYNIYDPLSVDRATLNSFTATTLQDMEFSIREAYVNGGFDLFALPGGTAAAVIGAEYRDEYFQDIYDSLSEAGQIVGSAGNSASGSRDIYAGYAEVLLPFLDGFELNLAGRYDRYSDYGADFTPKASIRWRAHDSLTLRASYGEGFRAPPLDILTQAPSYAGASVTHGPTCILQGLTPPCGARQVITYSIANPDMESERSKQFGFGAIWDPAGWVSLTLDYYNIKVNNQVSSIGIQAILDCLSGTGTLCPSSLSYFPSDTVLPNVPLGLGLIVDPATGGVIGGQTGYTNIGDIRTQGYDFSLRTSFDFGAWGSLRNNLLLSYVSEYSVNDAPSVAGRPGYPRMRGNLGTTWTWGNLSLTWNASYIHATQSQAYRNAVVGDSDFGLPHRLPSWLVHDLQLNYNAPWNARITLGVKNVADREAVLDPWYNAGYGDFDYALYDTWGRIPYFRYTQRF